jgi:hypothetical protein
MSNTAQGRALAALEADVRKGVVKFALIEGAFVLFALLPGLLRLFVYNDGISKDRVQLYLVGLLGGYVVVSTILSWRFLIGPIQRLSAFKAKSKA